MEVFIDHYIVLGLPSGEEGFKISQKEITKAYRSKALELHPDKRRDNRNAVIDFQRLQSSYEILKNDHTRKDFDAGLVIRMQQQKVGQRYKPKGTRRRKMSEDEERKYWRMMSDLEKIKIMKMMHDQEERNRVIMMASMKERSRKKMRYDPDDINRAWLSRLVR